MKENETKTDSKLIANYKEQLRIATEVVGLFERSDYEQNKETYQKEIFELMQAIQEFGSPPEGLLREENGPMTPPQDPAMSGCNQM